MIGASEMKNAVRVRHAKQLIWGKEGEEVAASKNEWMNKSGSCLFLLTWPEPFLNRPLLLWLLHPSAEQRMTRW